MPKPLFTPGAALKTLMGDYQLNPGKLAKAISMSQSAIRQIVIGKTGVSIPTALRLAKYFGTTPEYWITLQANADLAEAAKDAKLSAVIKSISKAQKPLAAAVKKQKSPAVKSTGKAGAAKAKKVPAAKGRKPKKS